MTEPTTNRTETGQWARLSEALDLAQKPLREDFEWLVGEYSRLREDLAAAYDVIRRLLAEWTVIRTVAPWGREWHGPDGELEAVSAAHDAVLDAVAGPNAQDDGEEDMRPWQALQLRTDTLRNAAGPDDTEENRSE